MKVKSKMSCPVRKEDGNQTTIIKEFEEDIPDKGRHSIICNKCIEDSYPQCREWCPMERKKQQVYLKFLDIYI